MGRDRGIVVISEKKKERERKREKEKELRTSIYEKI